MGLGSQSHFSQAPRANIGRSVLDLSHNHLTTFNAGVLVPVFYTEILPGDTFEMNVSSFTRMATPIVPVMDNAFLDYYSFFVPNRLVWDHWINFMGESDKAYLPSVSYVVPKVNNGSNFTFTVGGLADHLGIPPGLYYSSNNNQNKGVMALPFRAYHLIWNEWFRAEFQQDPVLIPDGETDQQGTGNYPYSYNNLLPVNRYHDYFSSSTPSPQFGPAVSIPLDPSPVVTGPDHDELSLDGSLATLRLNSSVVSGSSGGFFGRAANQAANTNANLAYAQTSNTAFNTTAVIRPSNVWADNSAAGTILALRYAFQVQKLLERDLYGTRYKEILLSHFGVDSPDARLQRPEFLGGAHIPINVQQVVQTSSSTQSNRPLGDTAAFSKTTDMRHLFTKSFVEHGMLFVLACVRHDRSYQQGIPRQFTRETRYDYYWPEFAHIGATPIRNQEIWVDHSANPAINSNYGIFGYSEAWAEYRYFPNQVTGGFRMTSSTDLGYGIWHYADFYDVLPSLSSGWMQEGDEAIQRTLAVDSSVSDQFLSDWHFKIRASRPMPVDSNPGWADHF